MVHALPFIKKMQFWLIKQFFFLNDKLVIDKFIKLTTWFFPFSPVSMSVYVLETFERTEEKTKKER